MTSLAYEIVNGNLIEVVDGQKRTVSSEPVRKDGGKSKTKKNSHSDTSGALQIMQSYGYSIKTAEERRIALIDFKKINKRAAKKGQAPLKKKESASYASVSREQFPKSGSGFKVVSGGVETNRRKH